MALKLYLLPIGYTFLIFAICLSPNPDRAIALVAIRKSRVLGGWKNIPYMQKWQMWQVQTSTALRQ